MAHSIQVVGDRSERFDDGDLLVLLHLMMAEGRKRGSVWPESDELVRSWRDICATTGPGTIDLDIDSLVADSAKQMFVLDVLAAVDASLPPQGEMSTDALLQDWQIPDVLLSSHFPVAGLHDAIARLSKMLRGSRQEEWVTGRRSDERAIRRIAHIKAHLDHGFNVGLSLRNIETGQGDPAACMRSLSGHALAAAMYEWFQNGSLHLVRQWCRVASKLDRLYEESNEPFIAGPGAKLLRLLKPLVSNDRGLIDWFAHREQDFDPKRIENHKTHDYWAYQAVVALRGEWARLIERCERVMSDPPTGSSERKYLVDHQFHLALARGDIGTMQDVLKQLVTPQSMRPRDDDESGFTSDLIFTPAVIYAKIAWYHGYPVRVDSPYIPAEWLSTEPLSHYDDPYPFMK